MTSVRQGVRVLSIAEGGPAIAGESDALDVIGDAFGHEAEVVAVPVSRLAPEFFELRTGVAGAVVQKFVNYRVRLVIVGGLPEHVGGSGPVADWVREANAGRDLWFVADGAELDSRLATRGERGRLGLRLGEVAVGTPHGPGDRSRPASSSRERDDPRVSVDPIRPDEGGESACWMHLICPGCGLLTDDDPPPVVCPRCGEERE